MSEYPDFDTEDVWAVARALVDYGIQPEDDDRGGGTYCGYCFRREGRDDRIHHHPACPLPKAQDLLTGAPEPYSIPLKWEKEVET